MKTKLELEILLALQNSIMELIYSEKCVKEKMSNLKKENLYTPKKEAIINEYLTQIDECINKLDTTKKEIYRILAQPLESSNVLKFKNNNLCY